MLLALLLMLQSTAPPSDATNDTLQAVRYRGELLRRDNDGFSPVDDFELIRFMDSSNRPQGNVVLQSGNDREPWLNCLATPGIRYVHDGVPYRIEPIALGTRREFTEGDTWKQDRRTFRVGGLTRHANRDCRELFVSEGPARNHKLLVDVQDRSLALLTQRVFMGRGDEFRLTLERQPSEPKTAANTKFIAKLTELAAAVKARSTEKTSKSDLSGSQIQVVTAALPQLEKLAAAGWTRKFTKRIAFETTSAMDRSKALAILQGALLGKQLPVFAGTTIDGKTFDSKKLAGHVTILHVWQYRDDPLTEPYGQTAYLDFLADQYSNQPVKVIGVNVDSRYADNRQATRANRSARKLIEFMNISFPVVANDGSLLRKLGDPRSASATLPLWIVIDKRGIVRVWKSGYYNVDSRLGLRELRKTVDGLLK